MLGHHKIHRSFFACLLAGAMLLFAGHAHAQALMDAKNPNAPPPEYLLNANSMSYDQQSQIMTADGDVELMDGNNILKTDQLVINQANNTVQTNGAVSIRSPDGSIFFAKRAYLSSDLKDGYALNVGLLAPDKSRFAATDARRVAGDYTVFSKGLFSPCALCEKDPTSPPLWQIRAAKVTHNNITKDLIYRDAVMEFAGIPVFYSPYLSAPDPTVKRRSGFLSPSLGRNSDLGPFGRIPYYYTFGPDLDYTMVPTFSETDGLRYLGTLRKRFEKGEMRVDHSIMVGQRLDEDGITKYDQIRGHLSGFFTYNIDNVFRTGAKFQVETDKNYLTRYGENPDDVLTNRVYLEGFKGRDYGTLEMYYFQDNRPAPRPEQPLVLPRATFSAFGEPNHLLGGRWSFDGLMTALNRDDGADTRKLGLDTGWERRDVLPGGLVSVLTGDVRDDVFWVDNLPDPSTVGSFYNDNYNNRLFPQGQIKLSYPLAADFGSFSHIVEPIVALTASPTLKYDPRIPDEDSLDFEFDTTNLFDLNRYPGSDQQEQGTRVTYGVRTGIYANQGSYGEMTLGQNYRITPDPNFPIGSGLDTEFSDYVGQFRFQTVGLRNPRTMRFDYEFDLDHDLSTFRKHDVRLTIGSPMFMPTVSYLFLDPPPTSTTGIGSVEELRYGFSSTFYKYYTFTVGQVQNLLPGAPGLLTTDVTLAYNDECFNTSIGYTHDSTVRTGVANGDTFMFRIYFNHLGGIDSGRN